MKVRLLLTVILFSACGTTVLDKSKFSSEELLIYTMEYVSDAKKHNKPIEDYKLSSLRVDFKVLDDDTAGICETYSSSKLQIYIDTDYWNYINSSHKIILMYHELAHCLHGMGHIEGRYHIMNSYLMPYKEFDKNSKYYIEELFK